MKYLFLLFLSFSSTITLAHGEDKPGPNKGFIRMPGAYHVELVPINKRELRVYLLDISWKNPSTKDASVEITHVLKSKKTKLICKSEKLEFFDCITPSKIDLTKKAKLIVNSKRESQVGNEVSYDLPLKLENIDDGHGGKH